MWKFLVKNQSIEVLEREVLADHQIQYVQFRFTVDGDWRRFHIAYGADAKMQAQKLLDDAAGLFAGGALSDEDKEAVFNALQKVYWEIKVEKAKKSE